VSNEEDTTRPDPANFDLKNPSAGWRRSTAVGGSTDDATSRGRDNEVARHARVIHKLQGHLATLLDMESSTPCERSVSL